MKDEFWFPCFDTLQLGPYGRDEPGECGCLVAKIHECETGAGHSK